MTDGSGTDLMTTGEVARQLGATTQHVRNLCDKGELRVVHVGSHRRVLRADFEAFVGQQRGLTRDKLRSLWLHQAVAGKLVMRPAVVLMQAQRNLTKLRAEHPNGRVVDQFDDWERLLRSPLEQLLSTLTSTSQRAIELRQNSPFAGVLTGHERTQILNSFKANWKQPA